MLTSNEGDGASQAPTTTGKSHHQFEDHLIIRKRGLP